MIGWHILHVNTQHASCAGLRAVAALQTSFDAADGGKSWPRLVPAKIWADLEVFLVEDRADEQRFAGSCLVDGLLHELHTGLASGSAPGLNRPQLGVGVRWQQRLLLHRA